MMGAKVKTDVAHRDTVNWLFDGTHKLQEMQLLSSGLKTSPLRFDWDEGVAHVEFETTTAHANFIGTVHGGMVATMIDELACIVGVSLVGWQRFRGTAASHIVYVNPLKLGRVFGTARRLSGGRGGLLVVEAVLRDENDFEAARGTVTLALTALPNAEER